ncbi:flagellar hook-basal body complex protein FliE [Shewanella sp. A25]|nr:flagellar hook-basal body complex protein FliE [Shewanella shenzhenensis]
MNTIDTQSLLLNKMSQLQELASGEIIAPAASSDGISQSFVDVVRNINAQQNLASEMMRAVDAGESQDVVGTMVTSQKASLSFNMLMEVRNKLLDSFDDVMRMSI